MGLYENYKMSKLLNPDEPKPLKDWFVFAVAADGKGTSVIVFGGPSRSEQMPQCAMQIEMETSGEPFSEIMDYIKFDAEVPSVPGIYVWEGDLSYWQSQSFEAPFPDDGGLDAHGEFTLLYSVEALS